MPISGPSSYPATVNEFITHWQAVNTALQPATEMVVTSGTAGFIVDDLITYGDALQVQRDAVTDARVDRTLARQQLTEQVTALQARAVEFNNRVRADFAGTAWERTLPTAFSVGDAESAVSDGLRYMSRMWTRINALSTPPPGQSLPMRLLGGLTLAAFNTEVAALRDLYRTLKDAEVDLRVAREMRNDQQDKIYDLLKAYRLKVPTSLPVGHALRDSLPVLTPPDGHTPEAVTVTATLNATTNQAELSWTASADADLARYEVRGVAGDEYDTEDEDLLASILPGAPLSYVTSYALGTPGLTAGFKVYVVLDTGRERGSTPVFVSRPV